MSKSLIQNIDFANKKAPEGANFNNGGVHASRFELFKKYYEHLNDTPTARKIYNLISSLDTAV